MMKLYRDRAAGWKWQRVREMRETPTPCEKLLWAKLKRRQLGVGFHRQKLIGGYIVDFWCPKFKLIVEVDGPYHQSPKQIIYDQNRDQALRAYGAKIVRFSNRQIITDVDYVLYMIRSALRKTT